MAASQPHSSRPPATPCLLQGRYGDSLLHDIMSHFWLIQACWDQASTYRTSLDSILEDVVKRTWVSRGQGCVWVGGWWWCWWCGWVGVHWVSVAGYRSLAVTCEGARAGRLAGRWQPCRQASCTEWVAGSPARVCSIAFRAPLCL